MMALLSQGMLRIYCIHVFAADPGISRQWQCRRRYRQSGRILSGMNLYIVDDPDYPLASVVRMLRTESLVGIDEYLPPDGVNTDHGDR